MMNLMPRDEREAAVDNAGDRLSYLVLAYGVLAAAAWRSFNGDPTWDLLALVVVAGAAGLAYRLRKGVVTRAWSLVAVLSIAIAAVVGVLVATGMVR